MSPAEPLDDADSEIPTLTDVVPDVDSPLNVDRNMLIAELQTKLATRTYLLADELLRSALASMQATLLEQISARLRKELPELIDSTLREQLDTQDIG